MAFDVSGFGDSFGKFYGMTSTMIKDYQSSSEKYHQKERNKTLSENLAKAHSGSSSKSSSASAPSSPQKDYSAEVQSALDLPIDDKNSPLAQGNLSNEDYTKALDSVANAPMPKIALGGGDPTATPSGVKDVAAANINAEEGKKQEMTDGQKAAVAGLNSLSHSLSNRGGIGTPETELSLTDLHIEPSSISPSAIPTPGASGVPIPGAPVSGGVQPSYGGAPDAFMAQGGAIPSAGGAQMPQGGSPMPQGARDVGAPAPQAPQHSPELQSALARNQAFIDYYSGEDGNPEMLQKLYAQRRQLEFGGQMQQQYAAIQRGDRKAVASMLGNINMVQTDGTQYAQEADGSLSVYRNGKLLQRNVQFRPEDIQSAFGLHATMEHFFQTGDIGSLQSLQSGFMSMNDEHKKVVIAHMQQAGGQAANLAKVLMSGMARASSGGGSGGQTASNGLVHDYAHNKVTVGKNGPAVGRIVEGEGGEQLIIPASWSEERYAGVASQCQKHGWVPTFSIDSNGEGTVVGASPDGHLYAVTEDGFREVKRLDAPSGSTQSRGGGSAAQTSLSPLQVKQSLDRAAPGLVDDWRGSFSGDSHFPSAGAPEGSAIPAATSRRRPATRATGSQQASRGRAPASQRSGSSNRSRPAQRPAQTAKKPVAQAPAKASAPAKQAPKKPAPKTAGTSSRADLPDWYKSMAGKVGRWLAGGESPKAPETKEEPNGYTAFANGVKRVFSDDGKESKPTKFTPLTKTKAAKAIRSAGESIQKNVLDPVRDARNAIQEKGELGRKEIEAAQKGAVTAKTQADNKRRQRVLRAEEAVGKAVSDAGKRRVKEVSAPSGVHINGVTLKDALLRGEKPAKKAISQLTKAIEEVHAKVVGTAQSAAKAMDDAGKRRAKEVSAPSDIHIDGVTLKDALARGGEAAKQALNQVATELEDAMANRAKEVSESSGVRYKGSPIADQLAPLLEKVKDLRQVAAEMSDRGYDLSSKNEASKARAVEHLNEKAQAGAAKLGASAQKMAIGARASMHSVGDNLSRKKFTTLKELGRATVDKVEEGGRKAEEGVRKAAIKTQAAIKDARQRAGKMSDLGYDLSSKNEASKARAMEHLNEKVRAKVDKVEEGVRKAAINTQAAMHSVGDNLSRKKFSTLKEIGRATVDKVEEGGRKVEEGVRKAATKTQAAMHSVGDDLSRKKFTTLKEIGKKGVRRASAQAAKDTVKMYDQNDDKAIHQGDISPLDIGYPAGKRGEEMKRALDARADTLKEAIKREPPEDSGIRFKGRTLRSMREDASAMGDAGRAVEVGAAMKAAAAKRGQDKDLKASADRVKHAAKQVASDVGSAVGRAIDAATPSRRLPPEHSGVGFKARPLFRRARDTISELKSAAKVSKEASDKINHSISEVQKAAESGDEAAMNKAVANLGETVNAQLPKELRQPKRTARQVAARTHYALSNAIEFVTSLGQVRDQSGVRFKGTTLAQARADAHEKGSRGGALFLGSAITASRNKRAVEGEIAQNAQAGAAKLGASAQKMAIDTQAAMHSVGDKLSRKKFTTLKELGRATVDKVEEGGRKAKEGVREAAINTQAAMHSVGDNLSRKKFSTLKAIAAKRIEASVAKDGSTVEQCNRALQKQFAELAKEHNPRLSKEQAEKTGLAAALVFLTISGEVPTQAPKKPKSKAKNTKNRRRK